ncbi:GAF and ANTAR domain-containing protein [Actinophytocola oryzae]|uniref:GAF domain-containing protein n=1 Tax=Actinophytocola oryzae TaxID=502181 RepID=A0A4R7VRG6_9PSEU|nr:GAF and ANTAR domain-containing protein [Actinophytocola oryzae]TDV52393.1 GAF domain-containing protein [Actinophytocola oryzae]
MTSKPAEELAETLVELADTLATEFDLDDFLRLLANRCVRLLDVDAVGVFLIDHGVVASSERAALIELAAQRNDEGPWRDCCRTGEEVAVPDLAAERDRWPRYVAAATLAGFAAVHAVPLCRREDLIGTLSLFRTERGPLEKSETRLARAMADVATIGILGTRALRRQETLAAQLQHALNSRVIIEQAKGVLAERLGLTTTTAFATLRSYARSNNTRVSELALSIVDGKFNTDLLRTEGPTC